MIGRPRVGVIEKTADIGTLNVYLRPLDAELGDDVWVRA